MKLIEISFEEPSIGILAVLLGNLKYVVLSKQTFLKLERVIWFRDTTFKISRRLAS